MLADSYSAWVRTTADHLPQVTREAYSGAWRVLAARSRIWGQQEYRSPRAGEHTTATGGSTEQAKHQEDRILAGSRAYSESRPKRSRPLGRVTLQDE